MHKSLQTGFITTLALGLIGISCSPGPSPELTEELLNECRGRLFNVKVQLETFTKGVSKGREKQTSLLGQLNGIVSSEEMIEITELIEDSYDSEPLPQAELTNSKSSNTEVLLTTCQDNLAVQRGIRGTILYIYDDTYNENVDLESLLSLRGGKER